MSKDYNNKGQEDSSEEKYDPPHSFLDELLSGPKRMEEIQEENESYNTGWRHTDDQKRSSSSSCFLTTACVEYAGLSDDCHELQVLRNFRDNYVVTLPKGDEILAEYYSTAPQIVRDIQASCHRDEVLQKLFNQVKEIVVLIDAGCNQQAANCYTNMFRALKQQHGL
jgi:hypothetical protein